VASQIRFDVVAVHARLGARRRHVPA
jgi:hypothetical protein